MAGLSRGHFRRGVEAAGDTPGGRQDRFPGFDVLALADTWDPVTAGTVLARLAPPPALRFFTPAEQATGVVLFDLLLDQREEPKVPVLAMVDARLAEGSTDGWHYEDMPEDGEAFRRSFAALDAEARERFGAPFHALESHDAADLVQYVQDRGAEPWHGMPAKHVWSLWTRYAATAFYSHPWAWNEMGYGGPAYPRGYQNFGVEKFEHWEVPDRTPHDPVQWSGTVEDARRRHAEVRSRQLAREHPDEPGPHGVGRGPGGPDGIAPAGAGQPS